MSGVIYVLHKGKEGALQCLMYRGLKLFLELGVYQDLEASLKIIYMVKN